jgi:hypothetical protein
MTHLTGTVSAVAATGDGFGFLDRPPARGRAAVPALQRALQPATRLLPPPPGLLPGAEVRVDPALRTLSLTSAYGEVLASEEVSAPEFAAALRRFHDRAMGNVNAVVVLDGIRYTRNAFLELVRQFNDCAARQARLAAH